MAQQYRIGQGLDLHRLVEGRPLVLGGVRIPFELGLLGHSDADVLLHAVIDAVLGASGQADIGQQFPNDRSEWQDADSLELLRLTWSKVSENGWRVENIDCTLLAERPKINPHVPQMKERISAVLGCAIGNCSIKATTLEKLGALGREEGIAAMAVVLLSREA